MKVTAHLVAALILCAGCDVPSQPGPVLNLTPRGSLLQSGTRVELWIPYTADSDEMVVTSFTTEFRGMCSGVIAAGVASVSWVGAGGAAGHPIVRSDLELRPGIRIRLVERHISTCDGGFRWTAEVI